MLNLTQTTFIIPLRIESTDRLRNIITTVSFLLNEFNTNIIIQEEDKESIFSQKALPLIKKCSNIKNLQHIFVYNTDSIFHRTRIINDMILKVNTEVICNYDADILLEKESWPIIFKV